MNASTDAKIEGVHSYRRCASELLPHLIRKRTIESLRLGIEQALA